MREASSNSGLLSSGSPARPRDPSTAALSGAVRTTAVYAAVQGSASSRSFHIEDDPAARPQDAMELAQVGSTSNQWNAWADSTAAAAPSDSPVASARPAR